MKHYPSQIAILIALCIACSGPSKGPKNTESVATPKDGFHEDPLSIAVFGGNVIAPNSHFAAYSFASNRVSVIDPDQEKEVWGTRVKGNFKSVFPLPGVDAVGLVSESEFRIVSRKEQMSFPLDIHLYRWRWAREARTAVFNDKGGRSGVVVRNTANGAWEVVNLAYPIPQGTADTQAPFISNDGLTVVELLQNPVGYMIYRADNAVSKMRKALVCEMNEEGLSHEADFKSAYSGGTDGQWLLISFDTKILVVDIRNSAACLDANSLKFTKVVATGPLRRVLFTEIGQAVVASESGEVKVIAIEEDGNVAVVNDLGKPCELPVGLNHLGNNLLALSCVKGALDGKVENVEFQIVDLNAAKVLHKVNLELAKLAGVAIDPDKKKVFEFLDGGLGELRIKDLSQGTSHSVRGLFVDGILNKL